MRLILSHFTRPLYHHPGGIPGFFFRWNRPFRSQYRSFFCTNKGSLVFLPAIHAMFFAGNFGSVLDCRKNGNPGLNPVLAGR